ncbi:hypothetical protein SLS63_007130 [Diaporthe eres]|uniref:Uncharacterized protein n=1 Tax=Diaporthe eres TaxID=83184 RepID=A0ABR1P626_DIAER
MAPSCDFEQPDPESLPAFKPQTRSYELDFTLPSGNVANSSFTAYRPGGTSQGSFDRPRDPRKGQADSLPSRSTARPKLAKDVEATPATAIHHSKASCATKKKRRSTNKETEGDPFLGTGKPMRRSSINIATTRTTEIPPSPSPARLRSSQLGGTPGLLSLHDAHDEVLSLLNTLKTAHRNQTMNEVDAALEECQEDLKARAKDKNTGTAESNILEREAARIGRARDEASRQAPEADGATCLGEDAAFEENLRLALTRLIEDARAALESAAQAKSQAASASAAPGGYIPYRAGEVFRLNALNFENQHLNGRVRRLQAEKEQALRKNSDLQKRLDELQASRRDEPFGPKLGPWGKDWNIDSRRGG